MEFENNIDNKLNSNNGITIISLVVTIVIILILSGVVVSNVNIRADIGKLNNMYADLTLLEEKVLTYYNRYNVIPKNDIDFMTQEDIINTLGNNRNINDNDIYYILDISKLETVTTNFGSQSTEDDVYIINDKTLTIYYLKGIEYKGEYHYRYPHQYSQI